MTNQVNRRLIELFAKDHTTACLSDDVIFHDHAQDRVFKGRDEVENLLQAIWAEGFPGAVTDVCNIVTDESAAVLEFVLHGRQSGPFMGIPATGRKVVLPMVIIFYLHDGRIRSANLYYDAGKLLRQLGLALDTNT